MAESNTPLKKGKLKEKHRPIIAITLGDPAGIGPEVVLGALKNHEVYKLAIPIVVGNLDVTRRCATQIGDQSLELKRINDLDEAEGKYGLIEILDIQMPEWQKMEPGKPQACAGRAADSFIRKACELALQRRIQAICTAPINKESLRKAGISEIGHTELLAKHLSAHDVLTLFITENMRIFFLSRHMSLREALDYITEERVYRMILRVDTAMKNLGYRTPKIAIAALNPHASDGNQFGTEESEILTPAIQHTISEGIKAYGPISADSVFHQALEGNFDCVISLYHDQGHIAAKTRDFFCTVTATLGLPVIRTSVDHGTGFDIAWQGKASSISMETAILTACDMLSKVKSMG